MSVRSVMRRLEKVKADRAARRLDAFNRYCAKYGEEPAVSAAIDVVCERITRAKPTHEPAHETNPPNRWLTWRKQQADASRAAVPWLGRGVRRNGR
jgi:hypothetical protein